MDFLGTGAPCLSSDMVFRWFRDRCLTKTNEDRAPRHPGVLLYGLEQLGSEDTVQRAVEKREEVYK